MKKRYEKSVRQIMKVDFKLHRKIISNFAKEFKDGHLWIKWNQDRKPLSMFTGKDLSMKVDFSHDKIAWITIPTFNLNKKTQDKFPAFLEKINKVKNKNIIVFDIRGNTGGNSYFGYRIISNLFGEKYVNNKLKIANENVFIDWRVSKGNISHLNELFKFNKQLFFKEIIDGMEASLKKGEKYYTESYDKSFIKISKHPHLSEQEKIPLYSIYVITDSVNGSSALTFIDMLKALEMNFTLIGETTGADRDYTELRVVGLPSGLGKLGFPIKVYRNRLRKDMESYIPDIKCEIHDTENLKNTILNLEK